MARTAPGASRSCPSAKRSRHRRRHDLAPSGRAHSRLGAGAARTGGPAHRRHRRLQAPRRPHRAALRAGQVRPARHRGDVRAAGVPAPEARTTRSPGCCARSPHFPDRAHVIGCYALGKAQRVISLLRESGYDEPIYLHGAMIGSARSTRSAAFRSASSGRSLEADKADLAGQIVIAPPSAHQGPLEPAAARPGAGASPRAG